MELSELVVSMKKSRLEKPKKQYPIDQCALFGIKGVGQLVKILNWPKSLGKLERLPYKKSSYRTWSNESGRWIEEPVGMLRDVQMRIATLLRRIEPPDYRQSGVRGRSYITNARKHTKPNPSVKLDISAFYPSTTSRHVYELFSETLKCSSDVAMILARLCCFEDDHLPTGGVHSEVVAFYAHKAIFDQLNARAQVRGGAFSVYVDDMMLTYDKVSSTDLRCASRLIEGHGLKVNAEKSRVIRKRDDKVITGVRISGGRVHGTQKAHGLVLQKFIQLDSATEANRRATAQSLLGHLDQIAQIDKRYEQKAKGNRIRLEPILNA